MKIYKLLLTILFILCIIDGLNGEFASPSFLDIIKWGSTIVALIIYFICKKLQK